MSTNNAVVAVIGLDQPGIVGCVSSVLTELGCNIEEMNQSTLHQQFAGIYLVNKPSTLDNDALTAALNKGANAKRLHVTITTRDFEEPLAPNCETEQFVISVNGTDRNDIIATFANIFGAQGINIDALRAFRVGEDASMQVFEVSIPVDLDTRTLHRVLLDRAKSMGLSLTMQHRAIFEAVHRIAVI